jgi:hypothetical protein
MYGYALTIGNSIEKNIYISDHRGKTSLSKLKLRARRSTNCFNMS